MDFPGEGYSQKLLAATRGLTKSFRPKTRNKSDGLGHILRESKAPIYNREVGNSKDPRKNVPWVSSSPMQVSIKFDDIQDMVSLQLYKAEQ